MTAFLLRVPVPWVFVLGYLIGAAFQRLVPISLFGDVRYDVTVVVGFAIFACGAAVAGSGWMTFYRARTTTVPGQASSTLVTWGPYRISRNPMYVGLTIAYVGEAVIQRHVWPLVLLPVVIAYVSVVVIPVEESKLIEVFGEQYAEYRARVRRWV
jgi:protein-S-isoprenylcysteine O-methyltransferase Ste14